MSIHEGHRDRVREKFLEHGLLAMHQHEMLEFLLFHTIPRKDTNPIAHNLINTFGDISKVFDASIEDLLKVKGITLNSAILIKSMTQFARVYTETKSSDLPLDSTENAGNFMLAKFIGRTDEAFIATFLDNKLSPIKSEILQEGSVNSVQVNVRKIVEYCIKYKATSVIIAHNHPGGIALPSAADIATTEKIRDSLKLIHVRLIDHLIIAENDYVSMADSNYL